MRRIRTGEHLTLRQFCLDNDEIERVRANENTGTLWREFEVYEHTPGAWRFRSITT